MILLYSKVYELFMHFIFIARFQEIYIHSKITDFLLEPHSISEYAEVMKF